MADSDKARLYREIVQQASEATLLERMRLHGFWPANVPLPEDSPQESRRRRPHRGRDDPAAGANTPG